jgi:hypothetical protein
MINWLLPYINAVALTAGIYLGGSLGGISALSIWDIFKDRAVDSIISNWYTFYTWSTYAFHTAAWNANLENPCQPCPFKGKRISVADPKFGKENAIFAEIPFFYEFKKKENIGNLGSPELYYLRENKLPITVLDPHEVKVDREHACNNPGPLALPGSFDKITCAIASIAHPNADGARQYSRTINCIVDDAFQLPTSCPPPPPQKPPAEPSAPLEPIPPIPPPEILTTE